jgi:hypothetical protein
MRKRSISRVIMIIAGFIAVCAILLSPSFSQVKIEKASEKETVLIQAPSDAIPGSAVKVDQPAVPLLTEIEEQEPKVYHPIVRSDRITRYLKVLFSTVIAPNAP